MRIELNEHYDFYASRLRGEYLSIYRKVLASLSKGVTKISVDLPSGDDVNEQLQLLYYAVDLDNPELFCYSKQVDFSASGSTLNLNYTFEYEKDDVPAFNEELIAEVNRIVEIIRKIDDDYEKLYRLNRYLCVRVRGFMSTEHIAGNAYGALIGKKSRCEGVCKAAKLILDALGFDNFIAFGEATANGATQMHTWNMVNVHGQWYHFDFMWNIGFSMEGKFAIPIYTFFDDETISIDHTPHYDYPRASDDSHLFWNIHKCRINSVFELADIDVLPFKQNYYAIAVFPEPLSEYEQTREIIRWMNTSFAQRNLSQNRGATYIPNLKLGVFFFEN